MNTGVVVLCTSSAGLLVCNSITGTTVPGSPPVLHWDSTSVEWSTRVHCTRYLVVPGTPSSTFGTFAMGLTKRWCTPL